MHIKGIEHFLILIILEKLGYNPERLGELRR